MNKITPPQIGFNRRSKKHFYFCVCISCLSFFVGLFVAWLVYHYRNRPSHNPLPDNVEVKIDSTNLPVLFINTMGHHISKEEYITAVMVLVENYCDTLYTKGDIEYDGLIELKYRGNSSFDYCDKKSYTVCAIDAPLKEGGKKKKVGLLGMQKGKKWALIANQIDKSMIRNALTYEIARPIMPYVPQSRFCEVFVDSTYYGVYALTETIERNRLRIEKKLYNSDGYEGGYLFEIDARDTVGGHQSKYWNFSYIFKYPKKEDLTKKQKIQIDKTIDEFEDALFLCKDVDKYFDLVSLTDYYILSEFSLNPSATNTSTFIYKECSDTIEKFKFVLWDYDLGYGNLSRIDLSDPCIGINNAWWPRLCDNSQFNQIVRDRWSYLRSNVLSNERVYNIIDSLTTVLLQCGAEKRNSEAWGSMWANDWTGPKRICGQKYISVSYREEVLYLKEWIKWRLERLDKRFLYDK